MSQPIFVVHLTDSKHPTKTLCREPWQTWQVRNRDGIPYMETVDVGGPRPRQDKVRQCQACLHIFRANHQ